MVMISPCGIILTVITNNNSRNTVERSRKEYGYWPRAPAVHGKKSFLLHRYTATREELLQHNYSCDLTSKFINRLKGFTRKINSHLLTDCCLDTQRFVVRATSTSIQITELAVLIRLHCFCCTVFLVTVLQIDKCHVFTLIHLSNARKLNQLFC